MTNTNTNTNNKTKTKKNPKDKTKTKTETKTKTKTKTKTETKNKTETKTKTKTNDGALKLFDTLFWKYLLYQYLLAETDQNVSNVVSFLIHFMKDFQNCNVFSDYSQIILSFFDTTTNTTTTVKKLQETMIKVRTKLEKDIPSLDMFAMKKEVANLKRVLKQEKMTVKNPKVWGATTWRLLYYLLTIKHLCMTATKNNIQRIMKTLPCPICRDHCETYGRENQTNFDTIQRKKGLRIYMIRFQNKINYDQGRRVIPMYMAMKQTRNL